MKKRIIILGSVIALLLLGWTGIWYFIAGQLREQVTQLAFNDGESAPQLQCGTLNITGFPANFAIDCTNASVLSGDILLEVPALRATALVYRPTQIRASLKGPALISDAFTGSRQSLAWSGLEASFRLDDWRIGRISIVADDLVWADQLFGDTTIAATPKLELHLLDMPEKLDLTTGRAAIAAFARAEAISAPGFDIANTNLEVEAELTGLVADLRNLGAVPVLPDWQRAGGTLNIVGIRATDATGDLNASGTLALDESGYPVGSITIDSKGVAERLGALIEEPYRTLVIGVPGEDGRHTNVLNFANGVLSSGLIPVAALMPLF